MIVPTPTQVVRILLRVFVAIFRITGYVSVATFEIAWHSFHGDRTAVGEAIGVLGRRTIDALAGVFGSD